MSTHSSRRIGRRAAERLLCDAPRRTRAARPGDQLGDLLAAAAAPARHSELAGEQAAVAAFRSARLTTAPQPRRRSMLKIALAKLLTAKIAAAASAVAVGGIAVAAAAGTLPGQHGNEKVPVGTRVAESSSASSSTTPGRPDKGESGKDNSGNPSPSPSLRGLCQAYTAHTNSGNDKPHDNPAFSALATAAGGPDKVPAFCADLLAGKDVGSDRGKGKGEAEDKPTHSKR